MSVSSLALASSKLCVPATKNFSTFKINADGSTEKRYYKSEKIDDALKAQSDEANRKAREDANAARLELAESTKDAIAAPTPEKTPDDLRRMASSIAASAERAPTNEVRNREMEGASKLNRQADELEKQQQQMAGKKVVTVTAQFQITVRSHITPQGVADHLKSKLPDELVAVLVACSGTE